MERRWRIWVEEVTQSDLYCYKVIQGDSGKMTFWTQVQDTHIPNTLSTKLFLKCGKQDKLLDRAATVCICSRFFFKIWRRKHVKSWWWVWGSSNSGSSCARSIAKEDTQMGWGNCCAQDWKYIKTFNWREHRREKPPSGASTETCQLVVTHHLLPGSQPVYLLLRFPTAWTIQETWPGQYSWMKTWVDEGKIFVLLKKPKRSFKIDD